MPHPIEALGLVKGRMAIQGLSFPVEAREIVAITGPNGPGKTTSRRG